MVFEALIIFLVTAVSSAFLVALIMRLSHKNSWYDHINERKIHSGDVPRLGGIGFAVVFIAAAAITLFTRETDIIIHYLPCLAGIFIIVISGVWDDFHPMRPLIKLLIQIIAALCVIIPGFMFTRIIYLETGFLENLTLLQYPITLLWIVGMTNAMNLIDGLDGLAGGISFIIALTFGVIFFGYTETVSIAILCVCLGGSIIGFLIFNAPIPKAKIFMGDGGSQFLGFVLALLPLIDRHDTAARLPVCYAAALLIIPIFDTTAAVWRRLRDRQSISSPDRAHIHHKLIRLGFSVRKINAILMSLQLMLSVLVYISLRCGGWMSLFILGCAYMLAFIFFIAIHFLNRKAILNSKGSSFSADAAMRPVSRIIAK